MAVNLDPSLNPDNWPKLDAKAEAATVAERASPPDAGVALPPLSGGGTTEPPRGRGRPPKHGRYAGQKKKKPGATTAPENPGVPETPADDELTALELAQLTNMQFFGICEAIGGEVMHPSPIEFKACSNGLAAIYDRYPGARPHPLFILTGAYVGYFAARLRQPPVRAKIGFGLRALWQSFKATARGIFRRRAPSTTDTAGSLNLHLGEKPSYEPATR
jgi:hypothetical protein